MPTISVIVPVYNTEKYLHRCVDSILAQTFTDFELILVDDGSTDSSGAICDEYAAKDSQVRVFHQENRGQAAARNLALDWVFANSDSEYISFVDSDDWVHEHFLELLYKAITDHNVNISQCGHLDTDGTAEQPSVDGHISVISPEEQYTQHYSAFVWDKLFCRKCFLEIRFPEGQIYEDLAICYRLLFAEEKLALVQETLYYYFLRDDSTVHQEWYPGRLARLDAWDEQIAFFSRFSNTLLEIALEHYCEILKGEYYLLNKSGGVSPEKKEVFRTDIRRITRKLLARFRKQLKTNSNYRWCQEVAYPIRFACYRKITRMVKRKHSP